jgi:hypothetical protein
LQVTLVLGDTGISSKNEHPFMFTTNASGSILSTILKSIPVIYANLTPAESKLSIDLLEILFPDKVPWATPKNCYSVRQQFVKNKSESSWDTDAVFVTIVVNNRNSTH